MQCDCVGRCVTQVKGGQETPLLASVYFALAEVVVLRSASMEDITDPREIFNHQVTRLKKIRDLIQNKLALYSSRLVGLKTILNAVKEAEKADLEVGKMSIGWWKDNIEGVLAKIEKMEILKCWNEAVESEMKKIKEETKTNTKAVPEHIFEVEAVLTSIKSMRSRMQGAVSLLRKALEEVQRPDTLLHLGLHAVTHCGLALEELPRTLR